MDIGKALHALGLAVLATGCVMQTEPEIATALSPDPALVALGEDAFVRCSGCHSSSPGAPSRSGPNLFGLFGRKAGSYPGYPFTDALQASGIVWDANSLNLYLANPTGTVPGSEMRRGTVRDAEQRAAIIAYLAALRQD